MKRQAFEETLSLHTIFKLSRLVRLDHHIDIVVMEETQEPDLC